MINGDGCSNRCQKETTSNNQGTNSTGSTTKGLTLVGNVNTNINNVFVVLKTDKKYSFTNQNEMESFMKTKFPDSSAVPSVYCSQEKHQIWIYSTVWQFTAVEFQIKNTRFNFHTIIMEILDLFQWMSILLLALSQPDQELLVDDLTQFIIHDDS